MTTPPPESTNPTPKADAPLNSASFPSNRLLAYAWQRHDIYSDNASNAQKRFFLIRRLLAYLGVIVVGLSVLQPMLFNQVKAGNFLEDLANASLVHLVREAFEGVSWSQPTTWGEPFSWIGGLALINFLLILLPIVATGLLAFAVKFDRGNNWILLRGNSETLKMEIFYYRTKVGLYQRNRNKVLAEKIQLVSERVKGSAVHQAALSPYEGQPPTRLQKGVLILFFETTINLVRKLGQTVWDFLLQFREEDVKPTPASALHQQGPAATPADEEKLQYLKRYADLDSDSYIQFRLEDQFDWYRRKAKAYDRDYQILQTSVYVFGGIGALLAAIGFQNWVAVSTSLTTALAGYLEYKRVEATLVGYNQAADALYDIRAWWSSLSNEDREKQSNYEKLVTSTEETIRSEHTSWLQDMQDRLANLYGEVGDEETDDKTNDEDIDSVDSPEVGTVASTPGQVEGDVNPPPAPAMPE